MENRRVAETLETIAKILEIQGENVFKVRAYQNAARTIAGLGTPVAEYVRQAKLDQLPGVGKALSEKVTQLVTTGRMEYYDRLTAAIPSGVLDLLRVPSLGPKKVQVLWKELGITSLRALEAACRNDCLVNAKGFGKRTQEKLLEGILFLGRHAGRYRLGDVVPRAREVLAGLLEMKEVVRAEPAGSVRRWKEVVKDVDILVSSTNPARVMERFFQTPGAKTVLAEGKTKAGLRLENGLQIDLRVVEEEAFAPALAYFTGSKEHNVLLRRRARKKGLKINEYGIFRGTRRLSCPDEDRFYRHLGLDFIPPELREGRGEIEAAEEGRLPELIVESDLRGIFHSHTTWSDGTAELVEMAEKARAMGLEYMGLSDHSKAAHYANGLDEERLLKQIREVDRLNRRWTGFRILKGSECDILPDGSLDLSDEVLGRLDFVIGSIHSRFEMPEAEMTRRVLRAIAHPRLTILGHPTGRLLLDREGYKIDLEAVIAAAKRHGKILELNANPHRLDLDWIWARRAKEEGVLLSINPDAHSTKGLEDIAYGIGTARRAWLEKKDILNTRPYSSLHERIGVRR